MPLTFEERTAFTYPAGAQTLHANFVANADGFWFASNGKAFAFSSAGVYESARDISFENLPTTQTVWGFTQLASGGWAVMTRQTGGTNTIGTIHEFTATGRAMRTFFVDAAIQGFIAGERFRAPKGLVEYGGKFYTRVVRSVAGNMRFLRYDAGTGNVDRVDLVLDQSAPSALTDLAVVASNLYVIRQTENRIYCVPFSSFQVDTAETTDLDSRNTSPWAASGYDGSVYVADRGGHIYRYSVPARAPTGGGGGGGFLLLSMIIANEVMGNDLARRVL